jgi:hypothetical protein
MARMVVRQEMVSFCPDCSTDQLICRMSMGCAMSVNWQHNLQELTEADLIRFEKSMDEKWQNRNDSYSRPKLPKKVTPLWAARVYVVTGVLVGGYFLSQWAWPFLRALWRAR